MKPKSTRQFLALVTSITAFAAGNAFATQYTWLGTILPRIKICGKEIFPLMLCHPIMLGSSND
jgi:hypothetical protein